MLAGHPITAPGSTSVVYPIERLAAYNVFQHQIPGQEYLPRPCTSFQENAKKNAIGRVEPINLCRTGKSVTKNRDRKLPLHAQKN